MSVITPCQMDPDLWFSTLKADQAQAVAGCQRCPLMDSCQQTAIDNKTQSGTWGGLTERQLRRRVAPKKPRKPSVPASCGTSSAYWGHVRNKESCDTCAAWRTATVHADRIRLLAEEHAKGGSRNGWQLHQRMGEQPCDLCRQAHNEFQAERRRNRNRNRTATAA
ncbi:WhiB family transcriptional regulator [Streptomyces sp. NPDC012693]|uniref:WhiB family transcriptional regulator n=1 Tax=Streptomyces sp. NPDC012693 TaxID=3364844 RepID=UPI0036C4337A